MDRFELQKLRDLPIEDIANSLGLTVHKHKALCPFHQDQHPSLSFHTGRNTYKCFVCDAHGSVIDLAMHLLGKNFKDTCRWLASQHGVGSMEYGVGKRIPNPYTLNPNPSEHPYTLHPKPYTEKEPRFLFPRGSQCRIYNLPVLKMLKEGEELWIAEGASDCWALLSSGHKAIAIPSATLLRKKDLESLHPKLSTLNLNMYPDADIPGEKLYLQLKAHLPTLQRHSLPPGIKDYSDYYLTTLTT